MIYYLDKQIEWSKKTFGLGLRTLGIIKHIEKETQEIIANPTSHKEWLDVVILALDGAWRTGATPHMIVNRLKEKQEINFARKWVDHTNLAQDEVSEHIREEGEKDGR